MGKQCRLNTAVKWRRQGFKGFVKVSVRWQVIVSFPKFSLLRRSSPALDDFKSMKLTEEELRWLNRWEKRERMWSLTRWIAVFNGIFGIRIGLACPRVLAQTFYSAPNKSDREIRAERQLRPCHEMGFHTEQREEFKSAGDDPGPDVGNEEDEDAHQNGQGQTVPEN